MNPTFNQFESAPSVANPSFALLVNLLNTIKELFEVDEHLQFVDRPQLFTLDAWRHSSIHEFDHLGPREIVHRALQKLANVDFIDVAMPIRNSDQFLLRLRADTILETIKEIKKPGKK
jgi:hypothetical protein